MKLISKITAAAVLGMWIHAFAPTDAHAGEGDAFKELWLGSAWYPEQWPEERWGQDLALMQAAGMNVVRIGEFAWSTLEPSEGQYDLDWMERAIRLAQQRGIVVVLGTPTNTPPAWLTSKYPDTLRTGPDGRKNEHGARRQFSISSPRYRELCKAIVKRLAERFGNDPNVIGWQIDNEYTDESFDAQARAQFQSWLQRRFKTLDALNDAWTTRYWSQTYSAWDQVPLNDKPGNPGLLLEHRHFVTDTWRSFQKDQVDAIRAHAQPRQFITTNAGGLGWTANWDHYRIADDLDIISWDPYVGQGPLNDARHGAVSDFVRGWKRKNFWVMETQPGFVNWAPVNTSLDKGGVRAMAWQSVGHGADAILYWQWRSALNGQEQYHGSIVGADGEPLPLYPEVQQLGREFKVASKVLAGTAPRAEVAIVTTYDSRWAIDFQLHNKNYDQLQVLLDYYRPLKRIAQTVDIVEATAPLQQYKAVFAPSLNVIPNELGKHLAEYVRQGGHLILGPRSGMKDEFNRLDTRRQPGPLVGTLGGRVEQYYALDETIPVSGDMGSGTASIWGEHLSARDGQTKVLLRFGADAGWLSNEAAAIQRKAGNGSITYLGALLDEKLMQTFIQQALDSAKVGTPFAGVPDDVEVNRRIAPGRTVNILINHGDQPRAVTLPKAMRDVLSAGRSVRELSLQPQAVAVLEE